MSQDGNVEGGSSTGTANTTTGRRSFLRRAAVAGGVAWVAPQVLTTPAGAAPVDWYLELDPDGNAVTTTTSTSCEPMGWVAGASPPVNGVDLDWTLTFNNGLDATQGFVLTFDDPGAVILESLAEETCLASSPPGEVRCVAGTPNGLNEVSFPDSFVPEQCLYDVFRIRVQSGS